MLFLLLFKNKNQGKKDGDLVANHVEIMQVFVTTYIYISELVDKIDNQIIISVHPYSW